jgi:hypothetical protein
LPPAPERWNAPLARDAAISGWTSPRRGRIVQREANQRNNMNVKCTCQHCNGHIEFETEGFQPGTRLECPHCKMETLLFIPNTVTARQRVKTHLELIRSNSAYPAIRFIINVCVLFSIISTLFLTPTVWAKAKGLELAAWQAPVVTVMLEGMAIAAAFAVQQSIFSVIDIADTLLHEHSKSKF